MEANEARIIPENLRELYDLVRTGRIYLCCNSDEDSNILMKHAPVVRRLIERIDDQAKQISELQAENGRLKQPMTGTEWKAARAKWESEHDGDFGCGQDIADTVLASRSKEQAQKGATE